VGTRKTGVHRVAYQGGVGDGGAVPLSPLLAKEGLGMVVRFLFLPSLLRRGWGWW